MRIFEARYLDMIARCLREDQEFGVAMIVEGSEVGPARTTHVGTTARVCDFDRSSDGLLNVLARGARRFKIHQVATQPDGLYVAEVEFLPESPPIAVPDEFEALASQLREVFPQVSEWYAESAPRFEDAAWLSARFAELVPLRLSERQQCLEMDDPIARLAYIRERLLAPQ